MAVSVSAVSLLWLQNYRNSVQEPGEDEERVKVEPDKLLDRLIDLSLDDICY